MEKIENKYQDDIFEPNLPMTIPIQRPKIDRLDKNQDQNTCCLQDIHFKYTDADRLKIKDGIKYTIQTLIIRKFYSAWGI